VPTVAHYGEAAESINCWPLPKGPSAMKLWVDDERPAPQGWRGVRSVAEAKVYLEQGLVIDMSLDHDLGACATCTAEGRHIGQMTRPDNTFFRYCPHVPSGYDLCVWMEATGRWPTSSVRVHSANPEGARRMLAVIARARRAAPEAQSWWRRAVARIAQLVAPRRTRA
jgi:hypothetical protein